MIRKAIPCLLVALLSAACGKSSPKIGIPADDLIRIVEAEDTRHWDAAAMEPYLTNANPKLRARAVLAAGRIGDEVLVTRLADVLTHDTDEDVAATAAFAIGEIESGKGAEILLQALQASKSPKVRGAAVEGLGKIAAVIPDKKQAGDDILEALKQPQQIAGKDFIPNAGHGVIVFKHG